MNSRGRHFEEERLQVEKKSKTELMWWITVEDIPKTVEEDKVVVDGRRGKTTVRLSWCDEQRAKSFRSFHGRLYDWVHVMNNRWVHSEASTEDCTTEFMWGDFIPKLPQYTVRLWWTTGDIIPKLPRKKKLLLLDVMNNRWEHFETIPDDEIVVVTRSGGE